MLEKVSWKTGEATLQNVFEPIADPTLRVVSQSQPSFSRVKALFRQPQPCASGYTQYFRFRFDKSYDRRESEESGGFPRAIPAADTAWAAKTTLPEEAIGLAGTTAMHW
jgi:hypothetical protein